MAYVSGGTVADRLPNATDVPSKNPSILVDEKLEIATKETERDLIDYTGTEASTPLKRENGGPRIWPEGYTGSFTNKGTVVLGAIVEFGDLRAIGIDLELNQPGRDMLGHTVREDDTPSDFDNDLSTLAGFSVKEAVYKAYYRIERRDVHYNDVRLTWTQSSGEIASGIAECRNEIELDFKCTIRDDWIISVASW